MMNTANTATKNTAAPIRNIRAFLKSYLQSESGKKALHRGPTRHGWGNCAMAQAFAKAIAE